MKSEWLEIKHVKALSLAKIQGIIILILSVVSTLVDSLFMIMSGGVANIDTTTYLSMAFAKIVLYPIIGFLLGLIIGFSYNKVTALIGGIKIKI